MGNCRTRKSGQVDYRDLCGLFLLPSRTSPDRSRIVGLAFLFASCFVLLGIFFYWRPLPKGHLLPFTAYTAGRSIFFLDLLGFVYDHMTFVLYPPGQLYQHSLGHLHTFTSVVVEHLLSPCQTLWSMCSAFGHTALSTSCSTRAAIEQTQTPDARSKPRLGHAKPITMRHSLLRRTSRGDGFSYLGEWEQRNRGNCFPRVRHREASPRHVRAGNEKPGDGVCGHGR